jgi:signal transduction histidine kinase
MGTLSLENAMIAIFSLLMLSTMSGLLLAVLAQPRRNQTNLLFALFCFSLLLWSLVALAGPFDELRFRLGERSRLNLLTAVIGLSSITFFLFAIRFVGRSSTLILGLGWASPFVLMISLFVLWNDSAFSAEFDPTLTGYHLLPTGYVVLGAQSAYALAAFWLIISSPQEPVRQMRLPGLLMLLVYASLFLETLLRLPLAILLATAAAARMGWVLLRVQLFKPMQELTDELRIANRDLRQTLADLGAEREKTAALTQQVEAASQYRSQFLDQLGHHLRTPLNSVVGYSQLLQTGLYGKLNEKQRDRLAALHRNTHILLDVINHMLDLNAIGAGRFELTQTPVPLAPLIEKVFEETRLTRPEKNAILTCDISPAVLPVYGDAQRLQQVLTQLIDNALKFTPAQPVEVKVRALNTCVTNGRSEPFPLPVLGWLGDGDWVILSVTDEGIGIAPEEQAQIFDEFFHSSDPRAADLAGAGLGLAVSKRLVELHEGTIWVKSLPEQGSTFFVALRGVRGGESAKG